MLLGGMKTIASLEVGQTGEILARLQKEQIPAEVRTTPQEDYNLFARIDRIEDPDARPIS